MFVSNLNVKLIHIIFKDLGKYFCLIANVKTGGNNEMPRRCFVFFANSEMLEVYKTIVSAFHVCAQQMGLSQEPKPVPKTRSSVSRDKTPTPPSISTTPSTSKNLNQVGFSFDSIIDFITVYSINLLNLYEAFSSTKNSIQLHS